MMQVKALNIDWKNVPPEVKPFISHTQTFITPGKEYPAYALSIYVKVVFLLIIDDLETPVFLPSWLFEIVSPDIPKDWICNLRVDDDVDMVIGTEFIAKDLEAYNSLADQEPEQLDRVWALVEKAS